MDRKRILIKGYYGFGNFGDDILLTTCYNFLLEKCPNAEFFIWSSSKSPYLVNFFSEAIITNQADTYDLIIHGGGGVHFDFENGSRFDLVINNIAKIIGYRLFSRLMIFQLRFKGIGLNSTKRRIGLGIGVGSFTQSSKKLRNALITICNYDYLIVRDKGSVNNFLKWNKIRPLVGTDLAFSTEHWLPSDLIIPERNSIKKIGVCLRNWMSLEYLKEMKKVVDVLSDKFKITYYILDKEYDRPLEYFFSEEECHIWDPNEKTLIEYLNKIDVDLMISARAHGVIVPAILGIPSVILQIEDKLRTIHEMLPNGTLLVENLNKANILEAVEKANSSYQQLRKGVRLDSKVQEEIIKSCLNEVRF